MRTAITLTAALAFAFSVHSASAQRSSGGGGTIGCDPGNPTLGSVKATDCSVFHKEALYGPSANPYAAGWHPAAPAVRHKKVVRPKKSDGALKNTGPGY